MQFQRILCKRVKEEVVFSCSFFFSHSCLALFVWRARLWFLCTWILPVQRTKHVTVVCTYSSSHCCVCTQLCTLLCVYTALHTDVCVHSFHTAVWAHCCVRIQLFTVLRAYTPSLCCVRTQLFTLLCVYTALCMVVCVYNSSHCSLAPA